jgi:hypothetical protein
MRQAIPNLRLHPTMPQSIRVRSPSWRARLATPARVPTARARAACRARGLSDPSLVAAILAHLQCLVEH